MARAIICSGYPDVVDTSTQSSASSAELTGLGQVEYRLARDQSVREYRRGRLSRLDICDAQTELMRVAQNLGRSTEEECPICEQAKLVHVTFGFGPCLPASGRAITSTAEMRKLAASLGDEVVFYIVEVCTDCRWNHLVRMFSSSVARRRARLGKT